MTRPALPALPAIPDTTPTSAPSRAATDSATDSATDAASDADRPLQALLGARPVASAPGAIHGVLTGTLDGFDALDGTPQVRLPGAAQALPARSTVTLRPSMVGASVVLVFEAGDATRPIVLGVLQDPQPGADGIAAATAGADRPQRLVLEAQDDIVLRNRHAAIRLTADGDIEIVGQRVTTRGQRLLRLLSPLIKLN